LRGKNFKGIIQIPDPKWLERKKELREKQEEKKVEKAKVLLRK